MNDASDDYIEDRRAILRELRKRDHGRVICEDDCISPPGLTVTYRGVTRTNIALICTEDNNHKGPHVARAEDDVVLAAWDRGTGRAG